MIIELVAASMQISRFLDLAYFAAIIGLALTIAYAWWNLLRQLAFDGVAIYAATITARRDDDRRRAELEMWQQQGRAAIEDRRAMLQAGSAAMWKAGVYDVEIDEARR